MIQKSTQNWSIGERVKVGFLNLIVERIELTPGDHKPDAYHLSSLDGSRQYRFVPHFGLSRVE
jgi:hypothetical protein